MARFALGQHYTYIIIIDVVVMWTLYRVTILCLRSTVTLSVQLLTGCLFLSLLHHIPIFNVSHN